MTGESNTPHTPEGLSRRRVLAGMGALLANIMIGSERNETMREKTVIPHVEFDPPVEILHETDLLQVGNWHNLAGAERTADGLVLHPTGLAIYNKRTSKEAGHRINDPNPPFNPDGPRLQFDGDFAIRTGIRGSEPLLQLYAAPPLRFDDFRLEQPRVDIRLTDSELSIEAVGDPSKPGIKKQFNVAGTGPNRHVEMRRINGDLVFYVDNDSTEVGRITTAEAGDVFASGEVWFGASSEANSAPVVISEISARPLNDANLSVIDPSTMRITQKSPDCLQDAVKRPNFLVGTAASLNQLLWDPRYAQLVLGGDFGRITPENGMKPQDIQPQRGVFTFGDADAFVDVVTRHGLEVHGHTLVYPSAQAQWMSELPVNTEAEKAEAKQIFENHIRTVVRRYKGKVKTWDVVNEAITGYWAEAKLQENVWYKAYDGDEYIARAFEIAHEEDPDAELIINDFGMDSPSENRFNVMYDLVKRLRDRGVPIHAVGFQCHVYDIRDDHIEPKVLAKRFKAFEDIGVKVYSSELDVSASAGLDKQADQYGAAVKTCVEADNCRGVTIWGATDAYGSTSEVVNGRFISNYNLIYTADYRAKKAEQAMRGSLAA